MTPLPSLNLGLLLLLIFFGCLVLLDANIVFEYLKKRKTSRSWWLIGLGLVAVFAYFGVLRVLGAYENPGPSRCFFALGTSAVLLLPTGRLFFLLKQASDENFVYRNILWLASVLSAFVFLIQWFVIAMGGPFGDQ